MDGGCRILRCVRLLASVQSGGFWFGGMLTKGLKVAFPYGAMPSTLAGRAPKAFPYGEGGLPRPKGLATPRGKTDEVPGGWNSRLYCDRGARQSVWGPHPALRATFPIGEGFWRPFALFLLRPRSKLTALPHRGKALGRRFPHQICIRIRLNHNGFY